MEVEITCADKDWDYFRVTSKKTLTMAQALEVQLKHGRPTEKYGFHNFKQRIVKGKHVATWKCSSGEK